MIFTDETDERELCILIGGATISLYSALTALLANLMMVIILTDVLQGVGIAFGRGNRHVLLQLVRLVLAHNQQTSSGMSHGQGRAA